MLQNDSRLWVRGSFLISQWHDPGKPSHGSLQHRNSLCTVAGSFLPGSHMVHYTAHSASHKTHLCRKKQLAMLSYNLALDARQYMQFIDSL